MAQSSGFSPELFVDPVDDDFICSICYGVFNHPVSCQDGHSFCTHCISQWQISHSRCPVDRSDLNAGLMIRNRAVEGAISRITMRCPSTISLPSGCSWTGPTACLENHLPRCDMRIVECSFHERGCIFRAYQRDLAPHLLVCPHRTVKCPACDVEIPHGDLTAHDELCVCKLVSCPNECGMQVERCKMLSHLAFVCSREGRPCPLFAVGCTEVHSLAEADSLGHLRLLLEARVSGASGGANAELGGISLAGSWRIEGDVTLPICSPLFDGHAAFVRLEISNGITVKLRLESKLNLVCFFVCLRCCFRCGVDKVRFNTPDALVCQASVGCVEIQNACPEDVFQGMVRDSNPLFLDFLLTLSV